MKPRRRKPHDGFLFTLTPDVRAVLERRGARSDRLKGPQGYTSQFALTFGLCEGALIRSDPRETRAWPEERYDRILDLVPQPEALVEFEITRLGDRMASQPGFPEMAENLGFASGELTALLNDLSFAEKLHLVDAATTRQAGRAAVQASHPPRGQSPPEKPAKRARIALAAPSRDRPSG